MPDLIRHDLTSKLLEKALDGLSQRQQAIGHNMANIDTPNFKATEVTFEEDLAAAIRRQPSPDALPLNVSDARHMGAFPQPVDVNGISPRATQLLTTSMRNDGNNVDVDREMTRLAETQLFFQAATQLVNVKFNQLKQAIWEGRK